MNGNPSQVFAARTLPDGRQVLVPLPGRPRSCHQAGGLPKIAFANRSEARRGAPKHQQVYRCGTCGWFHLATRKREAPGFAA